MNMSGERDIKVDRATVWAALLSPEMLKECVPGAQEVVGDPETGYTATVVQKVGPVKATFKGAVTISDRVEGESLTLSGEGKGGAAGRRTREAPSFGNVGPQAERELVASRRRSKDGSAAPQEG